MGIWLTGFESNTLGPIGSLSNDDGNGNENVPLSYLCYFAIISTRSTSTETANYPGTKLVGVAFKLRNKMKTSPSFVHVLHKTLNLIISRCCFTEDSKQMYQSLKRTCRAIVFFSLKLLFCGVVIPVAVLVA